MSSYEVIDLRVSYINIFLSTLNFIAFIYLSISFQRNFSNENKIKEVLNSKLENLLEITEILFYKDDERELYLTSKRKISNILSNLSNEKIKKYIKPDLIKELKEFFDNLYFSLEGNEKSYLRDKEIIYNKISEIQYLLYGLKEN